MLINYDPGNYLPPLWISWIIYVYMYTYMDVCTYMLIDYEPGAYLPPRSDSWVVYIVG